MSDEEDRPSPFPDRTDESVVAASLDESSFDPLCCFQSLPSLVAAISSSNSSHEQFQNEHFCTDVVIEHDEDDPFNSTIIYSDLTTLTDEEKGPFVDSIDENTTEILLTQDSFQDALHGDKIIYETCTSTMSDDSMLVTSSVSLTKDVKTNNTIADNNNILDKKKSEYSEFLSQLSIINYYKYLEEKYILYKSMHNAFIFCVDRFMLWMHGI